MQKKAWILRGTKVAHIHPCPYAFHARLRNHDLLTSLDVLTTGTYQRLPSGIKVLPNVAVT